MKSITEIKKAITEAGNLGYNTSFLTGFAENITELTLRDRKYRIGDRFTRGSDREYIVCALGFNGGNRRIGAFNVRDGTRLHSGEGVIIRGDFGNITADEIRDVLCLSSWEALLPVKLG